MNTLIPIASVLTLMIKGSVPITVTWLVLLCWKNASAAQRESLWCITFALIGLLPLSSFVALHWSLLKPEAMTLHASLADAPVVALSSNLPLPNPVLHRSASLTSWNALTMLSSIWCCGMFLIVSYRILGSCLLVQCYRFSTPLEDGVLEEMVASIRTKFGIHNLQIRVSTQCHVPMTWGTWRPMVMLPVQALDWTPQGLSTVLSHEMSHIKNHDHLKRLFALLVSAFYWPVPFVWLAAREWQCSQEKAADDVVLRSGASPDIYISQMIEVVRSCAPVPTLLFLPTVAMARSSTLEGRIVALLDNTRNRQSTGRRLWVLVIGLALVLGVGLGSVQLRASDAPVTSEDSRLEVKHKLNTVSLTLHLDQASLGEALSILAAECKRQNPTGHAISFIVSLQAEKQSKNLTMDLNIPVTVGDALRYVCTLAGVRYRIDANGIIRIRASDEIDEDMVRRSFQVSPTFFEHGQGNDVEANLKSKGLLLSPGSSVAYNPSFQTLIIVDTNDEIDLLKEMLADNRSGAKSSVNVPPGSNPPPQP